MPEYDHIPQPEHDRHIHEMISDAQNIDLAIERLISASKANGAPVQPRGMRALACARTKLDEVRHWLRDAQTLTEAGE